MAATLVTTSDLTSLSIFEMQHGLRAGDFSCLELVEAHLARIQLLEPRIHAFITLLPERAIAEAKAADDRLGVARSVRTGLLQLVDKLQCRARRTNGAIDLQHAAFHQFAHRLDGRFFKESPKLAEIGALHRQPGRHGVTAALDQ